MSYQKLLPVIGGNDLETNLNAIAAAMSKQAWLFPDLTNILSHGGVYAYPVLANDVVTTYNIDSTGTSIKTIVVGGTGIQYKIKPDGKVPLIASASAQAIFGSDTGVTNCMLMLVELPTNDYTKVSLTLATGSAAALTAQNVIVGEDMTFLAYPLGVYDDSGTKRAARAGLTLTYNGNSVNYEFDLAGITLETAG
jgi:hypothetical protein